MKLLVSALNIIICLTLTECAYAGDWVSITEVPEQGEEVGDSIRKYDFEYHKTVKDVNNKDVVMLDRIDKLDIHQLEYDIVQLNAQKAENAEIDQEIASKQKMVEAIKALQK